VNGALDRDWDWLFACARAFDETCADRSKTWPPPIMAPLAAAAAKTSLRRFYPFLSRHLLCLSTSPARFLEGAVAPACIGIASNPDIYIVWSGQLFRDQVRNVLESLDPADAVAEVERLLADWPGTWRG
jgi:hypothetical protein